VNDKGLQVDLGRRDAKKNVRRNHGPQLPRVLGNEPFSAPIQRPLPLTFRQLLAPDVPIFASDRNRLFGDRSQRRALGRGGHFVTLLDAMPPIRRGGQGLALKIMATHDRNVKKLRRIHRLCRGYLPSDISQPPGEYHTALNSVPLDEVGRIRGLS